jgi:hypothetical protein
VDAKQLLLEQSLHPFHELGVLVDFFLVLMGLTGANPKKNWLTGKIKYALVTLPGIFFIFGKLPSPCLNIFASEVTDSMI